MGHKAWTQVDFFLGGTFLYPKAFDFPLLLTFKLLNIPDGRGQKRGPFFETGYRLPFKGPVMIFVRMSKLCLAPQLWAECQSDEELLEI